MEKHSSPAVEELLAVAYNTEVEGYYFYTAAASMISDEHGKNVFAHLAKEEMTHIKVISAIVDKLKQGGEWLSYDEALKIDLDEPEGLPLYPEKNTMLDSLKENQTDLNAVTIAEGAEEKAVDFYAKMLGDAEDPLQKVFLTNLLEMEKGHLKLLRWERQSLVNNGFWCDMMEYSVEKEST